MGLKPSPPTTEAELYQRAQQLAGRRLGELAALVGVEVPTQLNRAKGWIGQLLELCLGATAQSLPEPDFPQLGIELKTLPISAQAKPLETTYVCTVPLTQVTGLQWQDSVVWHKLARVLWVPILTQRGEPLAERQVAMPFLWSPSPVEAARLAQDWEDFMERIALGQVETISAHQGDILQIRPKAAHGRVLQPAIGPEGGLIQTLPRGFYLRSQFTQGLLQAHFW